MHTMATVRNGKNQALVVVDVQVGVMADAWQADRVVAQVAAAVAQARAAGVPVLWVQHSSDDGLPHGSPAWQWVPALQPAAAEVLVHKRYNSAFEDTPLEAELARAGVSHIVLAGAATNWCIRATAYAALERGYDLSLLADAHSTSNMLLASGQLLAAADLVADLNLEMTWLRYPGRHNGAVPLAEFDFAPPRTEG